MLIYSPMTGLPTLGAHTPSHIAPFSSDAISFPDLLETQKAQIRLTSNTGVSSIHEVRCSVLVKGERSYPPLDQKEIVICPVSGEEIRLVRPLVLHDPSRSRVVLRLPESYRSRAHAVMSWWFDCLSRSSRPVIPAYAMQPQFEFLATGIVQIATSTRRTSSMNSLSEQKGRSEDSLLGPSSSQTPAQIGRVTQTTSLNDIEKQTLQTPMTSAPTKQVRSPKRPSKERLEASSGELPPPPTSPAKTRLDNAPDIDDDSIESSVNIESQFLGSSDSFDDDPGESTFLESGGALPSPTGSSGSLALNNLKPPPPSSELVAPIAPPSASGLSNLPPKSTVAYNGKDPSNLLKEANKPKRSTPKPPPPQKSTAMFGSTQHPLAKEMDSILDQIGTIERPALEGKADGLSLEGSTNAQVPAISSQDGILKSVLSDQNLSNFLEPATESKRANTTQTPSLSSMDAISQMQDLDSDLIPDVPTISRPMPASLAALRQEQQREPTAVRQMVGDGISVAPEAATPKPLGSSSLADWKRSKQAFWFETDLASQSCAIHFLFPRESSRLLNKQGRLKFNIQLHRMPTYPLLALLLIFQNADEETQYVLQCPLDIEDTEALIFLDILMQNFELRINLCTNTYKIYRDVHVTLPLEGNVEYLLNEARYWKEELGDAANYKQALKQFEDPDYDLLGKMSHNFNQDSFHTVESPSMARLASGIVSYWSDPEQFDYLTAIKSFPINHFQEIQKRVLRACLEFGIFLPENLIQKAIEFGFGESVPELLRKLLSSFAEVNLQLRHPNDLDPWDNLENWQKLFDACDAHNIEIDNDIEELAQAAQRRCHEDAEIPVESVDDFELFEDYQDMEPQDLLDLLNDPEHRLEAALALCEKRYVAAIEQVAAIFPHLPREEANSFCDVFLLLGPESEDYLISWLPLPRSYQREAAMLALGNLGSEKSIEPIIKRLRSGEEWETAAEALGRIGEAALPALAKELKNKNWLIRLRAVKALSKIQRPEARKLIEKLNRDPNEVVKAEVLSVLKQ